MSAADRCLKCGEFGPENITHAVEYELTEVGR